MERVLVTGGAGFIGSHTVDLLLKENKQVVVLDNLFSGRLENLDLQHPNLDFVEGDILEYPLIQDLLKGCDAVLHLAAIVSVPYSIENPVYSFQVNVQGLLHVLEAIRQASRPIRLVYASSAAVYGEAKTLPCHEDQGKSASNALSPYALQKLQDEEYADLYARLYGISSLGLRYFNVYGERQQPDSPYSGVISRFLAKYQQNSELTIFGDGLQSRDFISVKDVAMANCLALASTSQGVVNVATGQAETLQQLVKFIEEAGGRQAKVAFKPARAGDIVASYATTELAKEHLGFQFSVSLKDGIQQLVSIA